MKFKISDKIFERFPDINLGIILARNIDNKGESEEIEKMLRERENEIKNILNTEKLSDYPNIKVWREAFSSFGAKPKKYRSSIENLLRMILEGTQIRHINKLVDIYNYISIKYFVPIGGDDIDKVEGDIELKFATGKERFKELNSQEEKNPKEGEVVYTDNNDVLCRRWNWRECEKTKMIEDTKSALIVIESLLPMITEKFDLILNDFKELLEKNCTANVEIFILNKEKKEIKI